MARGRVINAIEDPIGEKRKTPRKKVRKCKVCGKLLSMYNDNKYCFVHMLKGYELEQQESDARKFVSYRKHQKRMRENKRVQLSDD